MVIGDAHFQPRSSQFRKIQIGQMNQNDGDWRQTPQTTRKTYQNYKQKKCLYFCQRADSPIAFQSITKLCRLQ